MKIADRPGHWPGTWLPKEERKVMNKEIKTAFDIAIEALQEAQEKTRLAMQSLSSIRKTIEEAEIPPRTLPFTSTESQLKEAIVGSFINWGPNSGREKPAVIEIAISSHGYTSRFFTLDSLVRETVSGLSTIKGKGSPLGSDNNDQSDNQSQSHQEKSTNQ